MDVTWPRLYLRGWLRGERLKRAWGFSRAMMKSGGARVHRFAMIKISPSSLFRRAVQTAGSREIPAVRENRDVHPSGGSQVLQASSAGDQTQRDLQADRWHGSGAHAAILPRGEFRLNALSIQWTVLIFFSCTYQKPSRDLEYSYRTHRPLFSRTVKTAVYTLEMGTTNETWMSIFPHRFISPINPTNFTILRYFL